MQILDTIIKLPLQTQSLNITFKMYRDYRLVNYGMLALRHATALHFSSDVKREKFKKIIMGAGHGGLRL